MTELLNRNYLTEKVVNLSLDHNKGIMQNKTIMLKRFLANQFDPSEVYQHYYKKTGIAVSCASSKLPEVDAHIFSELPALREYYENFSSDIMSITANLDSVAISKG